MSDTIAIILYLSLVHNEIKELLLLLIQVF